MGAAEDVAAGECGADGLGLDRRGGVIALVGECGEDGLSQVEGGEGGASGGCGWVCCGCVAVGVGGCWGRVLLGCRRGVVCV